MKRRLEAIYVALLKDNENTMERKCEYEECFKSNGNEKTHTHTYIKWL